MEAMRPGLREVFPGMGGGIGADIGLLPVRRGAVGIIGGKRRLVIPRRVAEDLAEGRDPTAVLDQEVPVEVADLVAEIESDEA